MKQMLGNCMEQPRNNWIRLFRAIPCFWFSCYFVSGRGTKAWLDVLVTDSAWFMFRWCRDCTGILQSPSFFFKITKQYKRIHINTFLSQFINTKHHYLCCLPNLVLSVSKRWASDCSTMIAPRPKPMWNRRYSVSCPRCGPCRKWRHQQSGLEVAGSSRLCLDFV